MGFQSFPEKAESFRRNPRAHCIGAAADRVYPPPHTQRLGLSWSSGGVVPCLAGSIGWSGP